MQIKLIVVVFCPPPENTVFGKLLTCCFVCGSQSSKTSSRKRIMINVISSVTWTTKQTTNSQKSKVFLVLLPIDKLACCHHRSLPMLTYNLINVYWLITELCLCFFDTDLIDLNQGTDFFIIIIYNFYVVLDTNCFVLFCFSKRWNQFNMQETLPILMRQDDR